MGNALHTPGAPGVGAVGPADARLDDAGLVAIQGSGGLDARTGVLHGPGSTALITGTSATAPMTVQVAVHHWVTTRGAVDGVYRGAAEVTKTVNIAAAPGSGSRTDVVYVKQNDAQSTISPDGSTAPVYGVVSLPTALPVGAEEIGRVVVAAGATATNGAGVTITQTARQTVARGAPVPVRTSAERDALATAWGTSADGLEVKRLDLGGLVQRRISGTWRDDIHSGSTGLASLASLAPASYSASFVANATTPLRSYKDQNGMVTLDGLATTVPASIASVIGTWLTLAAGHRPATARIGQCIVEGGGIATYQINPDGTVVGIALIVGAYPIPAGRYFSFAHAFKAA